MEKYTKDKKKYIGIRLNNIDLERFEKIKKNYEKKLKIRLSNSEIIRLIIVDAYQSK